MPSAETMLGLIAAARTTVPNRVRVMMSPSATEMMSVTMIRKR